MGVLNLAKNKRKLEDIFYSWAKTINTEVPSSPPVESSPSRFL